jgi:type I restriction-modification system DNA methylase subunit
LQKLEVDRATDSDQEKLEQLVPVFSSIAIDTGVIWTLEEAAEIRKKLNLQKRVDKYLVDSLIRTAKQLQQDGLHDIDTIHKLMMRSLFLLYLEDRGATDPAFYQQINKDAKSYFDILNGEEDTFLLFKKLEEHFNGNVFTLGENEEANVKKEHLQLIKKCFINGYEDSDQITLFPDWRLFNFQIIQIELLSEIYENFLGEIDPNKKKETGSFYTPPTLVELILNEKLPARKNDKNYHIKILDPACGSGIFLVESFKRLVKRYENAHNERLNDFEKLKKLLTDHIFGIELTPQSIKVAAFSLYLALLENLDPKTLWQKKQLPYLINDPDNISADKQGKNLFRRDSIETNEEVESLEFDLVVGNPPFGTEKKPDKILLKSIREYCNRESFAKEMVLPFLHKAVKFAPHGEIAMIFNTKILTNTGPTYQNFRRWLFNDCYVEKVYNFSILRNVPEDFGGQLFGSAIGPICIVFYKKEIPDNKLERIVYYAPKTFVKSNVLEGVVIDSTDVKYLPREECRKSDTKIWKIAMWGNNGDYTLINKISNEFSTISEYLNGENKGWFNGSGLHSPSEKQINNGEYFIPQKKVFNLKKVTRYFTKEDNATFIDKKFRPIDENLFKPPYLLIKEGRKDKEFCSSIIEFDFYHTGYSIVAPHDKLYLLKSLCGLINSDFSKYYLSLTSASWGIERERVQANEMLELPEIFTSDYHIIEVLSELIDEIIEQRKQDRDEKILSLRMRVDELILKRILGLSDNEIARIKDTHENSLDIFENKEKSKAFLPCQKIDVYAQMLCDELNEFLVDQNLFASATTYPNNNRNAPLALVKLSFGSEKKELIRSDENMDTILHELDQKLWKKKAENLYFRKKLNFYDGDDIYIIRPNQRRFWTQTMAMEDASELILEILNND